MVDFTLRRGPKSPLEAFMAFQDVFATFSDCCKYSGLTWQRIQGLASWKRTWKFLRQINCLSFSPKCTARIHKNTFNDVKRHHKKFFTLKKEDTELYKNDGVKIKLQISSYVFFNDALGYCAQWNHCLCSVLEAKEEME